MFPLVQFKQYRSKEALGSRSLKGDQRNSVDENTNRAALTLARVNKGKLGLWSLNDMQ